MLPFVSFLLTISNSFQAVMRGTHLPSLLSLPPKSVKILQEIKAHFHPRLISTGEEDGHLHWQHNGCHSKGYGGWIRRWFKLHGSFCVPVYHHPIWQQGVQDSPGSAVQQSCWCIFRYVVLSFASLHLIHTLQIGHLQIREGAALLHGLIPSVEFSQHLCGQGTPCCVAIVFSLSLIFEEMHSSALDRQVRLEAWKVPTFFRQKRAQDQITQYRNKRGSISQLDCFKQAFLKILGRGSRDGSLEKKPVHSFVLPGADQKGS